MSDHTKNETEQAMILNGQEVTFQTGETVYEVAQRHNHDIPVLCYDPRLEPFGACRLCVVEIDGINNPVASCTMAASRDMVVHTVTDRVKRHRRTLLEMVASENDSLHVDPLSGYSSQELVLLIRQHDARVDRFAGAQSGHSREDDNNPFILRDYNKCISCYRCVRVCAEQEGDYAISVMNRGFHTRITTEFDGLLRDSSCTFCGQCVQTCPTGALGDKKALRFAATG